MSKFFLTFILLFLVAISSAQSEQIKLKTDPLDATVYVRDLNGVQNMKLGNTPYEGNLGDIAGNYAKSNFFLIIIEKSGYETQTILLNDLMKSDIELSLTLIPKEDMLLYKKIDKAVSDLFESQRLMRLGQYDESISLLKKIESDQPKLSIVPEFMGAAFYLKKDNAGSLSWYEKAYRINPENKDAFTMKSYLRKALGADDAKK
ncbi:MAG: hypothetical protein K2Q18_17445 [Bdellovibrionales bacterium]|nr:hypothetical protein [Bdellovibrionales bacterium]